MNNGRFYKIVIVLLLLLNVGTLAFLWLNNNKEQATVHALPPHPPGKGINRVDRMLKEKLSFTPDQENAFKLLKEEHHGQMVSIQQEELELHKGLFMLLQSAEVDVVARDSFFEQLAKNDRKKEEVTFEHFAKLRLILSPEQIPQFDELVEDIANKILAQHRMDKGGPPPPAH